MTGRDNGTIRPEGGRRYAGEMIGGGADGGTLSSAQEVLQGTSQKGRLARILPFPGPAFIASIAYMGSGNSATNIQGGAQYGSLAAIDQRIAPRDRNPCGTPLMALGAGNAVARGSASRRTVAANARPEPQSRMVSRIP